MRNKLKEVFNQVQAEEELKNSTRAFLAKKTQGYTRMRISKRQHHLYIAACACLLLMLFGGRWLYFIPTAEISIDINPSIELSINRFDQVISASGFSEDGQELSKTLDIKFKNYTDVIKQILNDEKVVTLLSNNEIMTITVTGLDKIQSSKILSEVKVCTAEQKNTYCYFMPSEEVALAHEMGLSYGKYRAYLEVQSFEPSITPETIQSMTMREIWELLASLSADHINEDSSYNGGRNGHHGYGNGYRGGRGNGRKEYN